MRRRGAFAMAAAALAAAPAACDRALPGSGWFPLEAGHAWTYDVTTRRGPDAAERTSLTLRTHGSETVDGIDGGPALRRSSSDGVEYWLRADDTGVYRVATRSELEPRARADAPRRYVLKAPFAAGTQWQATTTAYVMRRRSEFPREIRHQHPSLPMTYTIEAVDETVRTPAGRFAPCLRVRGEAKVRLFADPVQGWRDLPLTTLEWYCRGVGLVRLQRDEPVASGFLDGGSVTLELVEWR